MGLAYKAVPSFTLIEKDRRQNEKKLILRDR